jgi:tRNA (guanine37-N1)-methyltransferase
VYANDLNPTSVHYLRANIKANKVAKWVLPFNMCGRRFLRLLTLAPPAIPPVPGSSGAAAGAADAAGAAADAAGAGEAPGTAEQSSAAGASASAPGSSSAAAGEEVPEGFQPPEGGLVFHHAVMNLPASAVEFVDAFRGAFDPAVHTGRLPMVHCYTFKRAIETEADVVAKVEGFLGSRLDAAPSIHVVRDVAPNKLMLCVSFRVPEAVAFMGREAQEGAQQDGSVSKRPRLEA